MGPSSDPPAPPPKSRPPILHFAEEDGSPSSLADAVMREISDRSPVPGTVQGARATAPGTAQGGLRAPAQGTVQGGLDLPPIIEPSELRPRSSNPPPPDRDDPEFGDNAFLPSIPPDAIVPGATSNEEFAVVPGNLGDLSVSQSEGADPEGDKRTARGVRRRRSA